MNKTNIKILATSFVLGFLFLGLTSSIKNINNIPNQSAGVILAQNDPNTNFYLTDINGNPIELETVELDFDPNNLDYGFDTQNLFDYNSINDGYGSNVNTNVPDLNNINFDPLPDYREVAPTFPSAPTASMDTNSEQGIVTCNGATECNIEELGRTARNLVKIVIEIGLTLAALAFAYAGWLFMSAQGDTGKITQAKGIFWKVLIGVIIAMSAFAIVEIILNSLGVTSGIGTWVNDFIG